GTTITADTDTILVSGTNMHQYASAVLIDTDKIFIAHRGTNSTLAGIVCTISGTTITAGTDTTLVSGTNTYQYASAVLIDTNKVFIAHNGNGSYLKGMICTISGTTITADTDTILVSGTNMHQYASAVLIDTNKIFIAHSSDTITNYYLNGMICTISGTTITAGSDTTLVSEINASNYASAILIDTDKIFISHRGDNSYLNGVVIDIETLIKTSTLKIDGLTKTECTTTTAGDVWILDTN
ncbi:MAG: hypothetical protein LIR50_06040, partial [Bacillota bacterium]|nr:hypothetical protein [Bacillota bacterium]